MTKDIDAKYLIYSKGGNMVKFIKFTFFSVICICLSGCTTLQYPINIGSTNSATEQMLLFKAIKNAVKSASVSRDGKNALSKLENKKAFIEVLGARDMEYLFRDQFEDMLRKENIRVVSDLNNYNFKFRVIVLQNGVNVVHFNALIESSKTLEASVSLHIQIVDRQSDEILYDDILKGNASYVQAYIFGFGPI